MEKQTNKKIIMHIENKTQRERYKCKHTDNHNKYK